MDRMGWVFGFFYDVGVGIAKFLIDGGKLRSHRRIDGVQVKLIPLWIDIYGRAQQGGRLLLAAERTRDHQVEFDTLSAKPIGQLGCLLFAEFRESIIVVAKTRLPVADQIYFLQAYFLTRVAREVFGFSQSLSPTAIVASLL